MIRASDPRAGRQASIDEGEEDYWIWDIQTMPAWILNPAQPLGHPEWADPVIVQLY